MSSVVGLSHTPHAESIYATLIERSNSIYTSPFPMLLLSSLRLSFHVDHSRLSAVISAHSVSSPSMTSPLPPPPSPLFFHEEGSDGDRKQRETLGRRRRCAPDALSASTTVESGEVRVGLVLSVTNSELKWIGMDWNRMKKRNQRRMNELSE